MPRSGVGGPSSGTENLPDWREASIMIRFHRSHRCDSSSWNLTTVLLNIVGRIRSAPSSVAFSISQSILGPLMGLTRR